MIRMTKLGTFVVAAVISVPGAAMAIDLGPTQASNYMHATRNLMCGPALRVNLQAGGTHTFNLKKAEYAYSDDGSTQWIIHHISHHLSFRPDDQIYFTHTYKATDGYWKFEKTDLKINRGGWGAVFGPILEIAKAIAQAKGADAGNIKPGDIIESTKQTAALVGGNWEGAVNILIANTALAGQNWQFCSM